MAGNYKARGRALRVGTRGRRRSRQAAAARIDAGWRTARRFGGSRRAGRSDRRLRSCFARPRSANPSRSWPPA